MTSPAKKRKTEDDTLVGFLHGLSPVKISRKKVRYFDVTLQTGPEEYHRVVVSSLKLRTAFEIAASAKTVVKLPNVQKSDSFSDPAGFYVFCTRSSSLEVVRNVPFLWRAPPTAGPMSVADVLARGPKQQVAAVRVKILPGREVTRVVPVNGVLRELKEMHVCDPSGQAKVTLWEEKIMMVESSRSYELTNLVTKTYKERTVLSSTWSTTAKEIDDVGEPASLEPRDGSTELIMLRGFVNGVQICAEHRCMTCRTGHFDFPKHCRAYRCGNCKMLQVPSCYRVFYSGTLVFHSNGEDHTLTLTNSAVCMLSKHLGGSASDVEAIEERLLAAEEVQVQVNSGYVVIAIVVPEANTSGQ